MKYLIIKIISKLFLKGCDDMTFTPNSPIVKAWVSMILAGTYTREDVPDLYNLREVVYSILDSLI